MDRCGVVLIVLAVAAVVANSSLGVFPAASGETSGSGPTIDFLGRYPRDAYTGWAVEAQGVAHDAGYWFFTQRDWLVKIPVDFDLATPICEPTWLVCDSAWTWDGPPPGARRVHFPDDLAERGYDHFGDLDQYAGFLFIPIRGPIPAIAVFRASDLEFLDFKEVPRQSGASWVALDPADGLLYSSNSTIDDARHEKRYCSIPLCHPDPQNQPLFRYRIDLDLLRRTGSLDESFSFHDTFTLSETDGSPLQWPFLHTQGGVFTPWGDFYLINGYLYTDWVYRAGIHLFDREGRLIAESENIGGLGGFKYAYDPDCDPPFSWSCNEPEGIDWWNRDSPILPRSPFIHGQLHAMMLNNNYDNDDQVNLYHYTVDYWYVKDNDTDRDGLDDYWEGYIYNTEPLNSDTDADGLSDRVEVDVYGTNPLTKDTDADGLSDLTEIRIGADPLEPSNVWKQATPTSSPPPTWAHAMAYDSRSDRVVLFGGILNDGGYSDQTWVYDPGTDLWTNMRPTVHPPRLAHLAMAYDSQSDRVILFGGRFVSSDSTRVFDDVWAYDYETNDWDLFPWLPWPFSHPAARYGHALAYDPKWDRVILFGGVGPGGDLVADTWAYDFDTNVARSMEPATPPLFYGFSDHAMAYESWSGQIILFGGESEGIFVDRFFSFSTFVYDLEANAWQRLELSNAPSARDQHAVVSLPSKGGLLLFGGRTGDPDGPVQSNGETWRYEYKFDKNPPVTAASLFGTPGQNDWFVSSVSVALNSFDPVGELAGVLYRLDGGFWLPYRDPFSVSGDGVHTVEYFAVDMAGNEEPVRSIQVKIDSTAPIFQSTSPSWTVTAKDVTIAWTASDATSGILRHEISVDGASFESVGSSTSRVIRFADGAHVVRVRALDAAGNAQETEIRFSVDTNLFSLSGPYRGVPTFALIVLLAVGTFIVLALRKRRRAAKEERPGRPGSP